MENKIYVFDINYNLSDILNKKNKSKKTLFYKLELDKINQLKEIDEVLFYTNILSELKYYIIIKDKSKNVTILSSNVRLIKALKKLKINSIKFEEYVKHIA